MHGANMKTVYTKFEILFFPIILSLYGIPVQDICKEGRKKGKPLTCSLPTVFVCGICKKWAPLLVS